MKQEAPRPKFIKNENISSIFPEQLKFKTWKISIFGLIYWSWLFRVWNIWTQNWILWLKFFVDSGLSKILPISRYLMMPWISPLLAWTWSIETISFQFVILPITAILAMSPAKVPWIETPSWSIWLIATSASTPSWW